MAYRKSELESAFDGGTLQDFVAAHNKQTAIENASNEFDDVHDD